MDILFLIRTLTYGGAERQLVALAQGLHKRGHRVRVMVFYPGGPLEPDLVGAGIPIVSVNKRGRWDMLRFFWRMARALRRERPDVVHGYLSASNLPALLLRPFYRGKAVWGVRTADIDHEGNDWLAWLDNMLERRLSRFADLIIANSHAGRAFAIARGFCASKTIVIPNGIDTDRFHPDAAGRSTFRNELGIDADQLLIGRVGRLDPRKDYPTFLRAATLIARQRPDARFICVGSGPADLESHLKSLALELGLGDRVIWTGARADMPAVYSAMDLSVSSSATEGTPNAVAEAMACGVPCVVTDVGDSAVIVGHHGSVVPKEDPDALAAAALRMLDELAAGRVDRAAVRAHVVGSLSLTSLIDRSEAALLGLLASEARSSRGIREAGA
jgi:glycosyltransferase involved in cell wall biosynthesis